MRKKDVEGWGCLIVIIFVIGGISAFFETFGFVIPTVIAIVIIATGVWLNKEAKKARRKELFEKYKDESVVEGIMAKTFWQGQTSEQLLDSFGEPLAIDNKVLKTKKKEIWKYDTIARNRYGLKITLENDIVMGWDQKA